MHAVLSGVQLDLAAAQHVPMLWRGAAAQNRLHTGDQLHDPEGFGDIVVRAVFQAIHLFFFSASGGNHHHGYAHGFRLRLQRPQDIQTALARQHHVQQNQIGRFQFQRPPEWRSALKAPGLEAGHVQGVHHQIADVLVVLHIIDAAHGSNSSMRRARSGSIAS